MQPPGTLSWYLHQGPFPGAVIMDAFLVHPSGTTLLPSRIVIILSLFDCVVSWWFLTHGPSDWAVMVVVFCSRASSVLIQVLALW